MVAFLGIIAVLAFGNAVFGVFELVQTWRPGATVFQQISARVDIGLSMLTMATAGGLAAILNQSEAQTAAIIAGLKGLRSSPASPPAAKPPEAQPNSPNPRAAMPQQQSNASVSMHRSVPFYLIGDEYVATVNGEEIKASTPDLIRLRISSALSKAE